MYESLGFNEVTVRKNYYPAAQGKDTVIMALSSEFRNVRSAKCNRAISPIKMTVFIPFGNFLRTVMVYIYHRHALSCLSIKLSHRCLSGALNASVPEMPVALLRDWFISIDKKPIKNITNCGQH